MALDAITIATQGLCSGSGLLISLQGLGDVIVISGTSNSGAPTMRRRVVPVDRKRQAFLDKLAAINREDQEVTDIIMEFIKCLN